MEFFAREFGKVAEYDFVYSLSSTNIDHVYSLSSTNIDQSISTKLGQNVCDHKISDEFDYGSNWTRTVQIICPYIRKFAIFDFVYTLASAIIDQSVPNLATIYMSIRSQMRSIMEQIKPEHLELFVLEFGKIAESDFVYTLIIASTNINRSAPKLVKMYVTIKARMRLIMDLIRPELSELFPLEFAKIAESDFVYTIASTNADQLVPDMVTVYTTMRSWTSLIMGQIQQ